MTAQPTAPMKLLRNIEPITTGKSPLIVGGSFLLAGYFRAVLTLTERPVSREFVAFRRKEQVSRLREFFINILSHRKINPPLAKGN